MTNKCEYCSKDLKDMNVENKNRHINKHIKNGHEKTSTIKPITGFFCKQAAVTNLASLLDYNNINEPIIINEIGSSECHIDLNMNLNKSFDELSNLLNIDNLVYKPVSILRYFFISYKQYALIETFFK